MSFEKEDFIDAGMEIEDVLSANAAVEWLIDHTTLNIDEEDADTLNNLPSVGKLFIVKFENINSSKRDMRVESESIAGMSQTFRKDSSSALIWELANQLISKYLKSNVQVFVNKEKWY